VRALVKATAAGSKDTLDHQKALIATKEQECRKHDQKLKNLYDAIAEESDRDVRAGRSQRAKEISLQLEQAKVALAELNREFDQANNVVDISDAMEFLKVFREGAFDALPVSAQAEILKNRVRRIVVREDGVFVEIYGRAPERILRLLDGGLKKEHPTQTPERSRTGVRTVSKLVERSYKYSNNQMRLNAYWFDGMASKLI